MFVYAQKIIDRYLKDFREVQQFEIRYHTITGFDSADSLLVDIMIEQLYLCGELFLRHFRSFAQLPYSLTGDITFPGMALI